MKLIHCNFLGNTSGKSENVWELTAFGDIVDYRPKARKACVTYIEFHFILASLAYEFNIVQLFTTDCYQRLGCAELYLQLSGFI